MYWGWFRYFQREAENPSFFLSFAAPIATERTSSLCTCPWTRRKACQRRLWASSESPHQARRWQNRGRPRMRTAGGRRGSVFSNGVCKQVQINQVWPYFHLETIFSNMSHILKNRFRCLELVQNSCKKCSVQMKKISLQCLLLSTFLTE